MFQKTKYTRLFIWNLNLYNFIYIYIRWSSFKHNWNQFSFGLFSESNYVVPTSSSPRKANGRHIFKISMNWRTQTLAKIYLPYCTPYCKNLNLICLSLSLSIYIYRQIRLRTLQYGVQYGALFGAWLTKKYCRGAIFVVHACTKSLHKGQKISCVPMSVALLNNTTILFFSFCKL